MTEDDDEPPFMVALKSGKAKKAKFFLDRGTVEDLKWTDNSAMFWARSPRATFTCTQRQPKSSSASWTARRARRWSGLRGRRRWKLRPPRFGFDSRLILREPRGSWTCFGAELWTPRLGIEMGDE